ncbi:MAG: EamA family transporter [Eubacteriales bacterium]
MSGKLGFIISMLMFGSIGIFVKNIDVPSTYIVQWRTVIGSLCLIGYFIMKKHKVDFDKMKQNWKPLGISGMVLGCSWVCLFEAYKNTSIAMSTIVYYCAPIIVFCASPILFKAKITKAQLVGISTAVIGMVLVNVVGISFNDFSFAMVYALGAAVMYAMIMLANKFIKDMDGVESTLVQLLIAVVVISTYCTLINGQLLYIPETKDLLLLIFVGVFHTGFALSIYFISLQKLSPQNIAIFSYLDPASALVFAFVLLGETLTWYQMVGAIFIFGGILFAQLKSEE